MQLSACSSDEDVRRQSSTNAEDITLEVHGREVQGDLLARVPQLASGWRGASEVLQISEPSAVACAGVAVTYIA